jgi:nucleotide-binding universal stress UspA family protein
MVIMGSKGASGLTEIFIGSNAERVIRNADCPVITVKGKANPDTIQSIAFATDTSEEQDLIVPVIKDFQKFLGLNLHLIRVCTPHNYLTETKAKEQLDAFAKRNKLENYSIGIAHGEFTDEGVIDFALRHKIPMIAMGTHGRTGLAHFFGGSITEDVANHANIPIFTIKIPKNKEVLA